MRITDQSRTISGEVFILGLRVSDFPAYESCEMIKLENESEMGEKG